MRPRLLVLLAILVGAAGLALVVRHRRTQGAEQSARIQQTAQRYLALEAAATARDETHWSVTQNLQAADQWCALTTDDLMSAINRWEHWGQTLQRWPGLRGLTEASEPYQKAGWVWERITWRPGTGSRSNILAGHFEFGWELLLSRAGERAVLQAEIILRWPRRTATSPEATEPDALELQYVSDQQAHVQFRPVQEFTLTIPTNTLFIDPLLYHETPAGPELLLVSARQRFQFRPQSAAQSATPGAWQTGPDLAGIPADHALAAALADFNGDGWPDLWIAGRAGLWIALGQADGDFQVPALRWSSPEPILHPECLAIADMDHDGDMDVWLTQYKNPYQKGQFPTPYYDASDGFPSFLLRNDGAAGFTEVTASAGLGRTRSRRTYSASWLDVNGDGAPDLINISDFAGLDIYHNDGRGHFTEMSAHLGEERHAFGMAHAVVDRNGDAFPDLLMVGMDSAWAARLDQLGLGLPDFPDHTRHRPAMTAGNRIFLGTTTGLRADASPTARSLARAGWAWGVAELDVENDGLPDYFFATGHETRASQRDYDRQFWLHDIYAAGSTNDPGAEVYFQAAAGRRSADHASYGGWQHQALLRDSGTNGYVESAWLSGLGLLADGRNAVAADFDGDGRSDIALTTVEGWPHPQQRLVIFRNETPDPGNWIGLRFRPGPGRKSSVNARIELETAAGIRRRWLVTGDGYRSQQTVQAHFGLGRQSAVISAVIHWSDGTKTELKHPTINQWHSVP